MISWRKFQKMKIKCIFLFKLKKYRLEQKKNRKSKFEVKAYNFTDPKTRIPFKLLKPFYKSYYSNIHQNTNKIIDEYVDRKINWTSEVQKLKFYTPEEFEIFKEEK